MSYTRDREGSVDGLTQFWSERLAGLSMGVPGGGVESALLGLLLNVESIGGEVISRAVNPEGAEIVVKSLPGQRIRDEVEHRFEVILRDEELLAAAGLTREELNRVLDVFGSAAAGSDFEYSRETENDTQRLSLRVW